VEIARHLPPRLLVHLNSERLVEVALGSCVTTGLNTEVFLAAAGVVLSWAHVLPLPLDNLLAPTAPTSATHWQRSAPPSNCSVVSTRPVARTGR
jgi:hypothetical protein